MAFRIYSNPTAITAQNNLTKSQNMLSTSIQRLSSGLRINSAVDDASGLAVSKKIEAQINGLAMANRNAQDGISMLQTAEGGLKAIGDMLLRMRELSVQAGNGTYTTSDRAELQKEVDQLKQEVDRVSSATEFNTKKLLNGNATALWSSSSDRLEAIITGEVDEGNYRVDVSAQGGKGAVYKSHIMRLSAGQFAGGLIRTAAGMNLAYAGTLEGQSFGTHGDTYALDIAATNTTGSASAVATFKAKGTGSSVILNATAATTADVSRSGFLEVTVASYISPTAGALQSVTAIDTVSWKFTDAKTGEIQEGVVNVTGTAGTAGTNASAAATITISGIGTGNDFSIIFGVDAGVQGTASATVALGSKVLSMVTENATATALADGGGTISLSSNGTGALFNGNDPLKIQYGPGELAITDNNDGKVDYTDVQIHTVYMNESDGSIETGAFFLKFAETSAGATVAGTSELFVNSGGEIATSTAKLMQLESFINSDGINIMDELQKITVYGAGADSKDVFLEGGYTMLDVDAALTAALIDVGLGATLESTGGDAAAMNEINDNLIRFIDTPGVPSVDKVAGTLIMQTGTIGDESRLSFVGGENIVNAFGLSQVIESREAVMEVQIYEAHTGLYLGSERTTESRVNSLLNGVMLDIGSTVGTKASWDANTSTVKFDPVGSVDTQYLHLVDNRTELQIGANAGQTMNVSVAQMDVKALRIDNAYVYDEVVAEKAIVKFDNALNDVNSARASIGAQMSRLQYTSTNLDTMRENLVAANSRMIDADIAAETTEFTRNQVLQQAATAMLAQAKSLPQAALALLQ